MKQFKVAMSDDLCARLEAASAKSGRSIADEIRVRVETTLAVDKPTLDFLEGLALMPAEVELETGAAWHKHAGSFAMFVGMILLRLDPLRPKGPIAFGARPHATVLNDEPNQLASLAEIRLRQNPNYSGSPERKRLEEAHQKMLADMRKSGAKITAHVVPKDQLPTFEQVQKEAEELQKRGKR